MVMKVHFKESKDREDFEFSILFRNNVSGLQWLKGDRLNLELTVIGSIIHVRFFFFSDTRDAKLVDSRILCCSYYDILRSGLHGKEQRNAKRSYEAPVEV